MVQDQIVNATYTPSKFLYFALYSLEEIVSKSTLLCGDRTQENA